MRKLAGVLVSAALLALLYAFVDFHSLVAAARATDPGWLAAGLSLVVPLTLLTAWRFALLVRDGHVGFGEANRLILAASTLNLFLPSKLGDLAKGHVLARRHRMKSSLAYSVVVLEKALDMASLLVWGVFGLLVVGWSRPLMLLFILPVGGLLTVLAVLIAPLRVLPRFLDAFGRLLPRKLGEAGAGFAQSWGELTAWFWGSPTRAGCVIALSIAIWGAHLIQFWLFSRALGGVVPILENAAFATLSILAGLLPFTFAGVGTRDAAIVYFYAPYLTAGAGALLGLLATLRYILPAIAGVPFVALFAGMGRASVDPAVVGNGRDRP